MCTEKGYIYTHTHPQTHTHTHIWTSQVVLVVKNLLANARYIRDAGSIPESGRSPWVGNDIPLQYSCLGNPMVRGAWWATVHEVTQESRHDLATNQVSVSLSLSRLHHHATVPLLSQSPTNTFFWHLVQKKRKLSLSGVTWCLFSLYHLICLKSFRKIHSCTHSQWVPEGQVWLHPDFGVEFLQREGTCMSSHPANKYSASRLVSMLLITSRQYPW